MLLGSSRNQTWHVGLVTSEFGNASVDVATKENMAKLIEVGENLLAKPTSRVNLNTGLSEPIGNGQTNAQALERFAKLLSEEKQQRELLKTPLKSYNDFTLKFHESLKTPLKSYNGFTLKFP
nr:putative galactolipase [Helianthus annuus]KAJ0585142.1 putative galactolipase [Helianthus annuus]KAJ0747690.1 putative galactolipase [Helianthus annuus]